VDGRSKAFIDAIRRGFMISGISRTRSIRSRPLGEADVRERNLVPVITEPFLPAEMQQVICEALSCVLKERRNNPGSGTG
jgi:hypothetical protein